MRRCNVVVALASILLGCLVLYLSAGLSGYDEHGVPGENYWPGIIAWLFIGLGALQFVELVVASKLNAERHVDLQSTAVRMAYASAIISALYGALLLFVGFVGATLTFIPAMMTLMGERNPWVSAVVAVAVVGTIYVFFALVFNTTLPTSILFE